MELPDTVPESIAETYRAACRLRHEDPAGAIEAARRCLWALLDDPCEIHERRLDDKIEVLRDLGEARQLPPCVAPKHLFAIDKVVGKRADIDGWIGLIEWLIDEWCIDDPIFEDRRSRCGARSTYKAMAAAACYIGGMRPSRP